VARWGQPFQRLPVALAQAEHRLDADLGAGCRWTSPDTPVLNAWAYRWRPQRQAHRVSDIPLTEHGVPRESRLNDAILYLSRTKRAHNVAQELPLHRLLALQERAIGMISVDTGPAHSAAALRCPLVVLFGTADPDLYARRSPNDSVICLRGCEHGRSSMLGISVDQVIDAWHALRTVRSDRLVRTVRQQSNRQ
jgi:Glycosyltransferase family 9 (heptosyltransferase)